MAKFCNNVAISRRVEVSGSSVQAVVDQACSDDIENSCDQIRECFAQCFLGSLEHTLTSSEVCIDPVQSDCSSFPVVNDFCSHGERILETPDRTGFKKDFLETEQRIVGCAEHYGWKFFYAPTSELQTLKTFLATHLNPETIDEYLRKVGKVKAMFQREFVKIENFLGTAENLRRAFPQPENDNERVRGVTSAGISLELQTSIRAAANILQGLENADLVAEQIRTLFALLQGIWQKQYCCDEDMQALRKNTFILQGLLRYMIEAQEGTYKSGRFSAEYFAQVLGFRDIQKLFFREDGSRRTIVDLGCGDGDLLMELAREYRRWVRSGTFSSILTSSLEDHGITLDIPDTSQVHEKIFQLFKNKKTDIARLVEPIDPQFIGVDQTRSFPSNLRSPENGISGRKGDICAPFENFNEQTKIAAGSVDVVTTTLTLDRAYSVENLFANMATMLRDDGRFMIATKGLIKAESDGEGGKNYKIEYGGKILTSNTYAGTLAKLQRELTKYGLEIDTLSCHPCMVSSSDCYPDEIGKGEIPHFSFGDDSENFSDSTVNSSDSPKKKYGPQEYNLMVISGRKVR